MLQCDHPLLKDKLDKLKEIICDKFNPSEIQLLNQIYNRIMQYPVPPELMGSTHKYSVNGDKERGPIDNYEENSQGLCKTCKQSKLKNRFATKCRHTYRPYYSKGLCQNCYSAHYYVKRKTKEQEKQKGKGGKTESHSGG